MVNWISNGIKETGIANIILSGGVAQNIKANKLISELDDLEYLFVPPGPGDESISIGAAFLEYINKTQSIKSVKSPTNGYLGPIYSEDLILKTIEKIVPRLQSSKDK